MKWTDGESGRDRAWSDGRRTCSQRRGVKVTGWGEWPGDNKSLRSLSSYFTVIAFVGNDSLMSQFVHCSDRRAVDTAAATSPCRDFQIIPTMMSGPGSRLCRNLSSRNAIPTHQGDQHDQGYFHNVR